MPLAPVPRSRPRRFGVTLLELIVVLTIAGLLLALALPRLGSAADRVAVRAAAAELGTLFSTARDRAITTRSLATVDIDTAGRVVSVRVAGAAILVRPVGALYGIALAANRDSMSYDPRGLGFGAANLSVSVRRGAAVETLFVSRLGRVRH